MLLNEICLHAAGLNRKYFSLLREVEFIELKKF
jgi:hypothetical protein